MAKNDSSKQYVYILIDTDFVEFDDVFYGVYATEEAANEAADKICNDWYKDYRHHFEVRKEEVKS